MKRLILGGVSPSENGYTFDYTYNYPTDIIHLFTKKVYNTVFKGAVYYFGYEFNSNVSSKQRADFIRYIKGTGDKTISHHELVQFIENPLNEMDKRIDMYSIDCFVYPSSQRSTLVQTIVDTMNGYCSRDAHKATYQLVKNAPVDIEFDWDTFEADIEPGTYRYSQMREYVDNHLLSAIHDLDYFSLAQNVKPKYRKYIKNFLNMTEQDAARFSRLKGQKIMIVDDINTSGSTLNEILRTVKKINHECEVYIFTLIGNFN